MWCVKTFLREQNISLPPNAILKSWHPKYSQDSVPDIVCTDLFDSSHTPEQPKKVRPSIEKEMNDLASPSQPKPTSLLERVLYFVVRLDFIITNRSRRNNVKQNLTLC